VQKNDIDAATRVLMRVIQAGVPGQIEARQRLERLQSSGK
jgi:hypothetical protein